MSIISYTWLAPAALLLSCSTSTSATTTDGYGAFQQGCGTADLVAKNLVLSPVPEDEIASEIAPTLAFPTSAVGGYAATLKLVAAEDIVGPCAQEVALAGSTTYHLRSGDSIRWDWDRQEQSAPKDQPPGGDKTFFKALHDEGLVHRNRGQSIEDAPSVGHPRDIEGRFAFAMPTGRRLTRRDGGAKGYVGVWEVSSSQWDVYAYCDDPSACKPFKLMTSTLPITMIDYTVMPHLPHTGLAVMQKEGERLRTLWFSWDCGGCPGPFASVGN